MMKKHGFTLAEVLITLAIIGVVATLTLPSLMSNTGEQQALTAYKKVINSLTEAGQMNAALEGYDYSSANGLGTAASDSASSGKMTLAAILNDRLQVNHNAGNGGYKTSTGTNKCSNTTFTLRDGTGICFPAEVIAAEYYNIYVDTNGPKGPNRVSSCDNDGCTGGDSKKHIFDQFPVVLHGGVAIPGKWSTAGTEATVDGEIRAALYAMGISRQSGSGS